jgi:uncharacterized membrane protein
MSVGDVSSDPAVHGVVVDQPPKDRTAGIVAPGILLGMGLGGFVDGIALHQLLQWHHMLTDRGDTSYPTTSVASLEDNTFWDGLFHAVAWLLVTVGLLLLWRAVHRGSRVAPPALVGLLLAGWGVFNVVEGVISHHLLTIHHVRDDVAEPMWWDLGFLASGVLLMVIGHLVYRRGVHADPLSHER